jgi:hypothetical protein
MKIYIREKTQKIQSILMDRNQESLYLMENYLSKSNCLVYLIFRYNTLLVENQIEKILIKKLKANLKKYNT